MASKKLGVFSVIEGAGNLHRKRCVCACHRGAKSKLPRHHRLFDQGFYLPACLPASRVQIPGLLDTLHILQPRELQQFVT